MKAVIRLDVPDWQIGQDVTVYFPDTMMKHGKCELLKEQEAVMPKRVHNNERASFDNYLCECKNELYYKQEYCDGCGRQVKWNDY